MLPIHHMYTLKLIKLKVNFLTLTTSQLFNSNIFLKLRSINLSTIKSSFPQSLVTFKIFMYLGTMILDTKLYFSLL